MNLVIVEAAIDAHNLLGRTEYRSIQFGFGWKISNKKPNRIFKSETETDRNLLITETENWVQFGSVRFGSVGFQFFGPVTHKPTRIKKKRKEICIDPVLKN